MIAHSVPQPLRWLLLVAIAVSLHTGSWALNVTTNTAPYNIYQLPIASISRDSSGNVTVTTTIAPYFQTGQTAVITGLPGPYGGYNGFNGSWTVASVVNSTFTYNDGNTNQACSGPANTGTADMTDQVRTSTLQQAITDVSNAGGGTVNITSNETYTINQPLFVDASNVSIVGSQGRATLQCDFSNGAPVFLVGVPMNPLNAAGKGITSGHYPAVTMDSSAGTRYGLRTKDSNGTTAFGYFPHCGLACGTFSLSWVDNGVETFAYWQPPVCNQNWADYSNYALYMYTIELAVQNNGAGTMSGNLCGVGSPVNANDMTDRSMIYRLGTDPANNNNLTYYFNTQNANGTLTTQSVSFNTNITDNAIHRITIQMDLTHATGSGNQCTVWLDGTLKNKLALAGGTLLNEYTYGAFHLGDVTSSSLAGNAAGADWTFCGLKMSDVLRYDETQAIGSTIVGLTYDSNGDDAGGYQTINDYNRFYWDGAKTVDLLPLSSAPSGNSLTCIPFNTGEHGNIGSFGYWVPDRPSAPVSGLSFEHLNPVGGIGFLMGEASSATFFDIKGCCNCCTWGTLEMPTYCAVNITDCDSLGTFDTFYAGSNQNLTMFRCSAYPARNFMRLHGVNGSVTAVMINGPSNQATYCFREFSGPGGGPLVLHEHLLR